MEQVPDARAFFHEQGFVVFTDVMTETENKAAIQALVEDLHEVNPTTTHITDPAKFSEADLPTSPNQTFRTTCNMAFGRFSWFIRGHSGVRDAFSAIHNVPKEELVCSWDNPFYTPKPTEAMREQVKSYTQAHHIERKALIHDAVLYDFTVHATALGPQLVLWRGEGSGSSLSLHNFPYMSSLN